MFTIPVYMPLVGYRLLAQRGAAAVVTAQTGTVNFRKGVSQSKGMSNVFDSVGSREVSLE